MTGYARAERRSDGRRVTVEIRSVNHKYCEVVTRLPREWGAMESEVKRLVQNRFSR
ncbi:MAG: stress-induced protein, partial [Nitrospirae bacterium]|nr:stress-induced protein [Nitrospirota bacterium]